MDWKESFQPSVLRQGWQLAASGAVAEPVRQGNVFSTVVRDGNQKYLVEARIPEGVIETITCSCEPAMHGRLCPHEAAFLFTLENLDSLDSVKELKPDDEPEEESFETENPASEDVEDASEPADDKPAETEETEETESEPGQPAPVLTEKETEEPDDDKDDKKETADSSTSDEPKQAVRPSTLDEYLRAASPDQLRTVITEYAKTNTDFRHMVLLKLCEEFPDEVMDEIFHQMDETARKYADEQGYIPASRSGAFLEELESLTSRKCDEALEQGFTGQGLEIVRYAMDLLKDTFYSDPKDASALMVDTLLDQVQTIMEMDPELYAMDIYSWLSGLIQERSFHHGRETVEDFLLTHFDEEPYTSLLKKALDDQILKEENGSNEPAARATLLLKEAELLKRTGQFSELEKLVSEHLEIGGLCQMWISHLMEDKEYTRALDFILDLRRKQLETPVQARSNSSSLVFLYDRLGQEDKALAELSEMVHTATQKDIQTVLDYARRVGMDKFVQEEDSILENMNLLDQARIAQRLEQKDRLFDLVKSDPSGLLAHEFDADLREYDPKRLQKVWLDCAEYLCSVAKDRADFLQAASALSQAVDLGAAKEASDLVERMKKRYPRRHSMIAILSAALG